MHKFHHPIVRFPHNVRRRATWGLVLAALTTMLTGCSLQHYWSREYWDEELGLNDPFEVLKTSTDGDKRARALSRIKEPLQNGGTREDQDRVIELLGKAARNEPEVLSRLSAIQALSEFKDPRVVEELKNAYYARDLKDFPSESAHVIRVQVINAFGRTSPSASGMALLKTILDQPPVDRTTSEQQKQQTLDERIAAARALSSYKTQESADLLTQVLQRERNVALRDRAGESLQVVTGERPGPDASLIDHVYSRVVPPRRSLAEREAANGPIIRTGGGLQQ